MALVRKLVPEDDSPYANYTAISNETMAEVSKVLDKMLSRAIFDFLIGYFVAKINWSDSLSHMTSGIQADPNSSRLLEAVSTLHIMMGGSHTRFVGIIVPIFEASVPLLCLCADKSFPRDAIEGRLHMTKTDPLGVGTSNVTRTECIQAARTALNCLQTLADVSSMAEAGARTLARLIGIVDSTPPLAQVYASPSRPADVAIQAPEAWSCDQIGAYMMRESQADFPFGNTELAETNSNWEAVLRDLTGSFGPEEVEVDQLTL